MGGLSGTAAEDPCSTGALRPHQVVSLDDQFKWFLSWFGGLATSQKQAMEINIFVLQKEKDTFSYHRFYSSGIKNVLLRPQFSLTACSRSLTWCMCGHGELEEGDHYCWSRSVNQRPSLQTGRNASRWKLLAIKSEKVEATGWVSVAKWRKLLPKCGRLMVASQGRWLCVTLPHAVTKLNQYFTFLCRRARDDRRPSFRAMSFQLEQVDPTSSSSWGPGWIKTRLD